MKKIILIALTMAAMMASAQVPHTFQSGQKAKAAEVNANFEYLASEIEKVADSKPPEPDCYVPPFFDGITYTPKTAPLGQVVLEGTPPLFPHAMYAFEYFNTSTGGKFTVALPLPHSIENGVPEGSGNMREVVHSSGFAAVPWTCGKRFNIGGYPASLILRGHQSANQRMTDGVLTLHREIFYSVELSILVDSQLLTLYLGTKGAGLYPGGGIDSIPKPEGTHLYKIPLHGYTHEDWQNHLKQLAEQTDILIDYVSIKEVTE